jgi:membrane associated rhomboid family serine protease
MCATLLHAAETHLTTPGPPPPQAIHVLIAALLVTWLSVSLAGPSISPLLAYSNVHKHWWTYATDGLHSSSPTLLATGLFLSYMFGRSLENSQGPVALLLTYTLACIGGGHQAAPLLLGI